MQAVVVAIPARLESNRLPGKPLLDCGGKPLLWHTWQAGVRWAGAENTWIVTDSQIIHDAMAGYGVNVLLRSEEHRSGSRRVFAAAAALPDCETLIDLQCDEPQIQPEDFDKLVDILWCWTCTVHAATLVCSFESDVERADPSAVKAVRSMQQRVLHFTRTNIPHTERHIGVYAFPRVTVGGLLKCRQSMLAVAEGLEQLEWLDNGYRIDAALVGRRMSVNTPEDLDRFRREIERDRQADKQ